jgi:CcmD family protein
MRYLYAAYLITWAVILVYIVTVLAGFKKVQDDMRDLER